MTDKLDAYDRIAVEAARHGIAIDARRDRDAELCRRQQREARDGVYSVTVDSNRYGWYVRPTSNLVNGGMRISENFETKAEAIEWAERYVAEDPDRRSIA